MTASGVRIYLHSPTRRRFLAESVEPQVRNLAKQSGDGQVLLRSGWLGGPHFDLRTIGSAGAIDWGEVATALAEGARRHPAATVSDSAYLRQAAELGRYESVAPPYPPLRPHGHTELLEPDEAPAGRSRLDGHRERGLALMLQPLLATAAIEDDGAALACVAEAFLVLADCHPHGMRFGTFSFRSHAEAFFHWTAPAADYRSSFATRVGKEGAVLDELVRRAHVGADSGPGAQWRSAFIACMASFRGQVADEDLDAAAPLVGPLPRPAGPSSFHAAMAASGVIDTPPAWFAAYRLTINLFYQLLPALDVSPLRRFYLCYALAETVDAVFGETWQARLASVQTQMAAAR